MTFDLLIKGGHVLDPAQGLDAPLDIAIAGGRIAALESDISPDQARRNAARAIGLSNELGAIAVSREADLSIIDVVSGRWRFTDTLAQPFSSDQSLVPVHTVRAGELIAPNWGPHPSGWLPESA